MILPTGTRIVSKTAIPGTAHVYPEGSPGVVIAAPVDSRHSYRIRLVDGFETSLTRDQFVLLRSVQKHASGPVQADALFDHDLNHCVIYRCTVGSRAYGLDNDDSDTDTRGIYLPPADRHWSLFGAPEQLENKVTDEVYWELQKFLVLALKANPNILEVLHSPLVEHATDLARELLDMRTAFVSKLVFQTYNGYVMSQFGKLTRRRDQQLEPKHKHAMHLIRLLLAGIATLQSGVVPVRVDGRQRERLLEIRHGALPFAELDRWRVELHRQFDDAFANTKLPDRPDYDAANAFLLRARRAALEGRS